MPTRDGYAEGTPSWVELGTPDVREAADFYGAVFDWEFRAENTPRPHHTALRHGLPAAGIGELDEPARPPGWTTYFAVDDADAVSARIGVAGGVIRFGPDQVGTAGRLVVAADPTGAVFGIRQAGDLLGAEVVNEHGGLNWNELITDDIDSATIFYTEVFGYQSDVEDWGDSHFYTTFKVADRGIAGGAAKPRPDIANHWNVYFSVDDADRAIMTATDNGGAILREARETEGVGVIARLADPAGSPFTIIELANEID